RRPRDQVSKFLPARRRSGRRTRGRGSILREPSHRIAVVLESFCALERVLRGVHHEVVLVVVLGGGPDRIKRNSNVLLARTEEPTYADMSAVTLPSRSTSISMISPILLSEGS